MRFRLLRRRLTISAPRVAVRSAMPWPLRWLIIAVVLGLCAAVALWTFELGKSIAGLDTGMQEELQRLRAEVAQLREDNFRQKEQTITVDSLRTAELAAMEKLAEQVRQLEADNRSLRDDLGFFEQLIPLESQGKALSIRGLQAEVLEGGAQLRWQVLAIQPSGNAPAFNGRLELMLGGTQGGEAWTAPAVEQKAQFRQYQRMQGVVEIPPQVVVKTVTARLLEGTQVRASQTFTLE